jgi:microcystin-dependent protein
LASNLSFLSDGTYGRELGRISPDGCRYGTIRAVRDVEYYYWWDGTVWNEFPEILDQAGSFALLPGPPRPFGELWRVIRYVPEKNKNVWDYYFWDSEQSLWRPIKWYWNLDNIGKLPTPGLIIGEAHKVTKQNVLAMFNGDEWMPPTHSSLYDDEPDRHFPAGFMQTLSPDAKLVYGSKTELHLEPLPGGSGRIWTGGEFVDASKSTAVFPALGALIYDAYTETVRVESIEPDIEYWVYLANSDSRFSVSGLPADEEKPAVPAWDFRRKLFLSRNVDINGYLSNSDTINARLVGSIKTDNTPYTEGGPYFVRELDISLISRTVAFPETFREYSDFVVEFVNEDTLKLRKIDGSYGLFYVAGSLNDLGTGATMYRDHARIEWNESLTSKVERDTTGISANTNYYLYFSGKIDEWNFNAINTLTGRPWQSTDSQAEDYYVAELDMRLTLFASTKLPDHNVFSEAWPGYTARYVGKVETDAKGLFVNSRDLSAIRQPIILPSTFDGLAEILFDVVSDTRINVIRKPGSSGVVNIRGDAVLTYPPSSGSVHFITNGSPVYVYDDQATPPLTQSGIVSDYQTRLNVYMANSRDFWGDHKNDVFVSSRDHINGFLSESYPGNNARWLFAFTPDANGKFTGPFIKESVIPVVAEIDDSVTETGKTWSSAKIDGKVDDSVESAVSGMTTYTNDYVSDYVDDFMAEYGPNQIVPYVTDYVFQNAIPAGVMLDFAGGSAPTGFLLCDGSAVSRSTYSKLYGVIGTIWGGGNGATTFNLPDFRRRVAVGSGGSGSGVLGANVGNVGGEENHTISNAEMPLHNHGGETGLTVTAVQEGSHGYSSPNVTGILETQGREHLHGINWDGQSQPHNNIQPSAIVLKIIKY